MARVSCRGLQEAWREPVSTEETSDDADSEIEANSPESWSLMQRNNSVLEDASKGVTDTTDKSYKR
jgi:hypothetical protein